MHVQKLKNEKEKNENKNATGFRMDPIFFNDSVYNDLTGNSQMNKFTLKELRLAVDDVLSFLVKANKWDKIINSLRDKLNDHWDAQTKAAINEAIGKLEGKEGNIIEKDAEKILKELNDKLGGKQFTKDLIDDVYTIQETTYQLGAADVKIDYEFGKQDKRALKWLKNDSTYWIGNHYESEVQESLREYVEWTIQQGMSKEEAGKYLRQMFGEQFQKSKSYWEGLSNHIVTRTREFGKTAGYEAAGISKIEVRAILGPHTCELCLAMHGKIYDISALVNQRNALMAAATPEETKKIAPWVTIDDIKGLNSTELEAKGIVLPPYHYHCRCTTIAHYEES